MEKRGNGEKALVIGACVVIMFAVWGMGNHPLSLYVVPITKSYGFPRALFAMIFSIINLFTAFGNLLFGKAEKSMGLKRLMLGGVISCILAYVLFSGGKSLPIFYLGAALFGLGIAFSTNNPLSMVANQWFPKRKGTVLGLIFAASGLGGTICDILVGRMIERTGFQRSLKITALMLAVLLLGAWLLLKTEPSVKKEKAGSLSGGETEAASKGLTFTQARKTKSFWFLLLTEVFWGLSIIPVMANLPAYLTDQGFDALFISGTAMALLYGVSAASKLSMGILNDRFGPYVMMLALGISSVLGMLLFLSASGKGCVIVGSVCMGIAFAMMTVPVPLLVGYVFGSRDFGTLIGIFSAVLTLAGAVGTPLSNLIYDRLGTYTPAFAVQTVLFAMALATGILAVWKRPKE